MHRVSFLAVTIAAVAATGASACSSESDDPFRNAPDAGTDDNQLGPPIDGGHSYDGGSVRADRFVTKVVSFTPGACGGFGADVMPQVVYGPPVGAGDSIGGLDVVALGTGGEIVLSFEPNEIVDGPGKDFIVFENVFNKLGDPAQPVANPGEISVSADGTTWKTFACTQTAYPYGDCAGWHPVYSNPQNGISPVDPAVAGGDAFDLASTGLASARYVKIVSKATEPPEKCPVVRPPDTNGFDLDAISIVNARLP